MILPEQVIVGAATKADIPETVDLIAKKLGFPREFFFGDEVDDLDKDSASFRSLTSMRRVSWGENDR